ncbi:MAG: ABC transporter ATP-binding protein [Gammaproteobacteria bacterium]|nr:ABC transporter ATP-binding protein [Gammaproteobacteria bacterium]
MSEAISATGAPDERSTLSLRELGRLVLRTWPYMRPQLPHLVAWIVARYALELVFLVATLIAFDLFNNKILLGEKLQHDQAALLQLDESHVRAPDTLGVDAEEEAVPRDALFDDADDVERPLDPAVTMNTEQRRVVRNRLGAVFAIAAILFFLLGPTIAETPTFLAGAVPLVGFSVWNLGTFQAANSRNGEFVEAGSELIGMWGVIQDMGVGLDRAFFLLDLKPDIVDADDAVPLPAPIREIRFERVAFGYDPARPVLSGIDLKAEAGTITAIVGGNGSGKSTLMSLLLRLYDPDAGTIRIDGVPLAGIRMESLRAGVAIALQQNTLFATTVADNIAYAKADASRQAIESAARVACADAFIREMAQGYDTKLGERGGKLSSGQRQRLSIARAIVRDTPILILDEPTASLDAETEHAVLENLSDWGRERIVFLITHRLSTIRNADQIAFLEDGEIRELGDHESLMSIPDGRYRRYVNAEVQIDASDLPE